MTAPLRVLFCERGVHGGSVRRMTTMTRYFRDHGEDPFLITHADVSRASESLAVLDDTRRATLGLKAFPQVYPVVRFLGVSLPRPEFIRYLWLAIRVVASFRPHCVYLNNFPAPHAPIVLIARLRGIPVIAHLRDTVEISGLNRSLMRFLARAVVLSEAHRGYYARAGVPAGKLHVIYNGIDLVAFDAAARAAPCDVPADRPLIVLVGTYGDRKRQIDAVEALARLPERHARACLVLAGDGPSRTAIGARAAALGVAERIVMTGMIDNVPALLRRCAAGLMVSDREGMATVVLEYMAAGLPVIATRLPGCDEMVTDGGTGDLIEVGDIDVLAARVTRLLDDPGRARQIGARGRAVLESGRFTTEDEMRQVRETARAVAFA